MDSIETQEASNRAAFASGLRKLADAIEADPDIDLPYCLVLHAPYDRDGAVRHLAAVARVLPTAAKSVDEHSFRLTGLLDGVRVVASAMRSLVCEKQTVVKEVEEWVCPDSLLAYDTAVDAAVSA